MIFKIRQISRHWNLPDLPDREVNTIDDLKRIVDELHPGWHNSGKDKSLIVNFGDREDDEEGPSIIIYDDYVE